MDSKTALIYKKYNLKTRSATRLRQNIKSFKPYQRMRKGAEFEQRFTKAALYELKRRKLPVRNTRRRTYNPFMLRW